MKRTLQQVRTIHLVGIVLAVIAGTATYVTAVSSAPSTSGGEASAWHLVLMAFLAGMSVERVIRRVVER